MKHLLKTTLISAIMCGCYINTVSANSDDKAPMNDLSKAPDYDATNMGLSVELGRALHIKEIYKPSTPYLAVEFKDPCANKNPNKNRLKDIGYLQNGGIIYFSSRDAILNNKTEFGNRYNASSTGVGIVLPPEPVKSMCLNALNKAKELNISEKHIARLEEIYQRILAIRETAFRSGKLNIPMVFCLASRGSIFNYSKPDKKGNVTGAFVDIVPFYEKVYNFDGNVYWENLNKPVRTYDMESIITEILGRDIYTSIDIKTALNINPKCKDEFDSPFPYDALLKSYQNAYVNTSSVKSTKEQLFSQLFSTTLNTLQIKIKYDKATGKNLFWVGGYLCGYDADKDS